MEIKEGMDLMNIQMETFEQFLFYVNLDSQSNEAIELIGMVNHFELIGNDLTVIFDMKFVDFELFDVIMKCLKGFSDTFNTEILFE